MAWFDTPVSRNPKSLRYEEVLRIKEEKGYPVYSNFIPLSEAEKRYINTGDWGPKGIPENIDFTNPGKPKDIYTKTVPSGVMVRVPETARMPELGDKIDIDPRKTMLPRSSMTEKEFEKKRLEETMLSKLKARAQRPKVQTSKTPTYQGLPVINDKVFYKGELIEKPDLPQRGGSFIDYSKHPIARQTSRQVQESEQRETSRAYSQAVREGRYQDSEEDFMKRNISKITKR